MKIIEAKNAQDLAGIQNKAIALLGKSRDAVHHALVVTLIHIWKHGDREGANNIITALQTTKEGKANRTKIINWLVVFGGLVYDEVSDSFVGWNGKDFIKEHLQEGKDNPWHKTKKAKEFTGLDINQALRDLTDKATKMQKKLPELSVEDAAKVHLVIDQQVLNVLLAHCGIEQALKAA